MFFVAESVVVPSLSYMHLFGVHPEGYAVAGVPLIAGGALVSEIIPVPIELNEWIRGPKFQPILLKVIG